MLYGCPHIHVYSDHKINMFARLQSQRVLRWRLFLDDYSVKFHYVSSSSNMLADVLSRLEEQKSYLLHSHDTYNPIQALYSSSQRDKYNSISSN
jgi:hypothetical protein